jgi:hypothetical protein
VCANGVDRTSYIQTEVLPFRGATRQPYPRMKHAACAHGSTLFIFGGCNDSGPMNDMWAFDTVQKTWKQIVQKGDIPSAAMGSSLVSTGTAAQSLFLFGGRTGHGPVNDLFHFDVRNHRWTRLDFGNGDHGKVIDVHAETYVDGNTSVAFKLRTGTAPLARYGHQAIVWNNILHVFGGSSVPERDWPNIWMLDVKKGLVHSSINHTTNILCAC